MWWGKYYVKYMGCLIFLDFGFFLVTLYWVPPLTPQYNEIEPQGYKRSLAAHIACVGVKYYANYFGSLIFLDFDFFLVNNSWVPPPTS